MKGKVESKRLTEIQTLAGSLAIPVTDWRYLHQALTHTSFANENRQLQVVHNERLEFLGDAVLELVISNYLFRTYPDYPEGDLTKIRAAIVCEPTLAKQALRLQLGRYLLLGKGEESSGGRERTSTLADAFEAVIGAIYVDAGLETASQFILKELRSELRLIHRGEYTRDYKTMLQELIQRHNEGRISYEVIDEIGPDHDKQFTIAVRINGHQQGIGTGRSKKEAEQAAAAAAYTSMQ